MIPLELQNLQKQQLVCARPARSRQLTFVVSGIAPLMTAYNSGSRYFGKSSASKAEKAGVSSEGLSAQALPAAMAPA